MQPRSRKAADVPLRVRADVRLSPKEITIQSSEVELQNIKVTTTGKVGLAESMPADLAVRADKIALQGLDAMLPMLKEYNLSGEVGVDTKIRHALLGSDMPALNGSITLKNVGATAAQLPKPLSGINGELVLNGNKAELRETTVTAGESRLNLSAKAESLFPLGGRLQDDFQRAAA